MSSRLFGGPPFTTGTIVVVSITHGLAVRRCHMAFFFSTSDMPFVRILFTSSASASAASSSSVSSEITSSSAARLDCAGFRKGSAEEEEEEEEEEEADEDEDEDEDEEEDEEEEGEEDELDDESAIGNESG